MNNPFLSLYNSHLVKSGKRIVFVEGNVHADAVTAAGFIGITFMGGINGMDHWDYTALKGQSVTIWRYCTEPGLNWQAALIKKLTNLGIKIDGVVQIPDGKPYGWSPAEADAWEIRQMVAEARPVRQPALKSNYWERSMEPYMGEPKEMEWLVDNVIPLGIPALLATDRDFGKRFNMLDIGIKIWQHLNAKKEVPADKTNIPASVLIITAHYSANEVYRRIKSIESDECAKAMNDHLIIVPKYFAGGSFLMIDLKEGKPVTTLEFEYFLRQLKSIEDLKLVVIDPVWPFAGGIINQVPGVLQGIWDALSRISKETGATVLVTLRNHEGNIFSFQEAREEAFVWNKVVDANRLDEQINDCCDNIVNDGAKPDGA